MDNTLNYRIIQI